MAIIKCKMCGGDIEITADKTFGTCEFCGNTMTLPKVDDDQRAAMFNRGNHFRRIGEFDKALSVYEHIVREDDTDAEAHWCCALCRFGIEYVEDPNTYEWLPTCHRASFDNFLEDVDYLAAVEYSEGITRRQYQKDAAKIAEVLRGILVTSQSEEPFDVFICYKESDENGERTRDSLMAQDVYYQLTDQGYRVFFARITLENIGGKQYEPYIFAALNSAKVMVVIGTKPEYLSAVWVKNEWSRFLTMMKKDRSKLLLPCYRDMDPYDMPEQLSVLQSYDMSRIGFIQDLIRGISKVLDAGKKPEPVKETTVVQQTAAVNTAAMLKRGSIALEDKEWEKAEGFFEEVLNQDPENVEAYLGKLMAELSVSKVEDLKDQKYPFDKLNNYQRALRYADEVLKSTLTGYIDFINTRNETARLDDIYIKAKSQMDTAKTEDDFKKAAKLFEFAGTYKDAATLAKKCREEAVECVYTVACNAMKKAAHELEYNSAANIFERIPDYKDSAELMRTCREKAETARKDTIHADGKNLMTGGEIRQYNAAVLLFKSIPGWKDADEMIAVCEQRVAEIKAQHEEEKQKNKREAELLRQEIEAKNRKNRKIFIIILCAICAGLIFFGVYVKVIKPMQAYNAAAALMEEEKYEEAIAAFEALGDYKDSKDQKRACLDAAQLAAKEENYNSAIMLMEVQDYRSAIAIFQSLDGYQDSAEQIEVCYAAINEADYNKAIDLFEAEKYMEARTWFMLLSGYKDSDEKANQAYELWKTERFSDVKIGDEIVCGVYEQDNNTSNGSEDIEWLVLDVKDSKVLVVSKYAIECLPYHSSNTNITWEACSLRAWLNEEFIAEAFSETEQAIIAEATVSPDNNEYYHMNSGNTTKDRVFLLSVPETWNYFESNDTRYCKPTKYALSRGAWADDRGIGWWWLRTPGAEQNKVSCGNNDLGINQMGVETNTDYIGVRPAMWISIDE